MLRVLRCCCVLAALSPAAAVIYSLNETEYARMPPLFLMDDYGACMRRRGGLYCLADVGLSAPAPNALMTLIEEYSAHTIKHFNHTRVHRAVCLTESCRAHVGGRNLSDPADRDAALEACVNDTLWSSYQLEGRVLEVQYCVSEGESLPLDAGDVTMLVVYLLILVLNAAGSFYDLFVLKKGEEGNPYLLAWSVRRSWRALTAPAERGLDPRLDRLKLFYGIRAMTMICVFFSHTTLIMTFSYLENPLYVEKAYDDPLKQILFNGSLVTYTFFVMSAFLLAYNYRLRAESRPVRWWDVPAGLALRWLRLTPVYALVLGTVATVWRRAGAGPLWRYVVGSEADACRRWWWAHLLYVNNYVYDDAFCAPQTWYLAADTQLFAVGLCALVWTHGARARRRWTLAALAVLSVLAPAAHTWWQDLDATVIQAPESYRSLYQHDATFRLLYVRGHTNLSTYTLGLLAGLLVYRWQRAPLDLAPYKRYRPAYWLLVPAGVAVILSGGAWYGDGPRAPRVWRVLYAAVYKPVFQALVLGIIVGCIFKFESVYRGVLEWRGWAWGGRAAYSAFLAHTLLQRAMFAVRRAPARVDDITIVTVLASTIFLSFLVAALLWLLLECPAARLVKALTAPRRAAPPGPQTKL